MQNMLNKKTINWSS